MLNALFEPKAIAVIGASRTPEAIGYRVVSALKVGGFERPIYPVNPNATEVAGLGCHRSVRDIPGPVDLAVMTVPAKLVSSLVDECQAKGVKAIVCITAGFAEAGPDGVAMQREIVDKARRHGIRLVGPNCFGVLNTDPQIKMNASFSSSFPPAGAIAMASQSGGLGLALVSQAKQLRLELSQFVSLGNKADVSSNDLLEYWENDTRTKVILLYLESFGNPHRFLEIARRVGRKKPILVLKSGRSKAGSRAAGSHTAAMSSSDDTVDAFLHQAGVLRVQTLEELFQTAAALSLQGEMMGRELAMMTNAGGPGILCADAAEAHGLRVVLPSPETKSALSAALPPAVAPANPLDLVASAGPEHFAKAIPILLGAPEFHALVILYTEIEKSFSRAILEAIRKGLEEARRRFACKRPVALCWIAESPLTEPIRVGEEEIPVFRYPEDSARALASLEAWHEVRTRGAATRPRLEIPTAPNACSKERWLPTDEVLSRLKDAGFSAPGATAGSAEEAVALAEKLGYPVAMKLVSRTITHKTEVGGVQLGLADAGSVKSAFARIEASLAKAAPTETLQAVLIQPMVTTGVEIFVGMHRDSVFGPVLAFGLGGVHVEILSDVVFRVAPLTERDAREMVRSIRGFRLLQGYRGARPADVAAVEALLLRASEFSLANPWLKSFDFNPVLALAEGKGCLVLDARLEQSV